MRIKLCIFISMLWSISISCKDQRSTLLLDKGISQELAEIRKKNITHLVYQLHFDIFKERDSLIHATNSITFHLAQKGHIILDFKEDRANIIHVELDGKPISWQFENEHLWLENINAGTHKLDIRFIAGEQSLNRRDDFLYTLLVPDRARTLFPCFDQPDLKAEYRLSLSLPQQWIGIGNGKTLKDSIIDSRRHIQFAPTEPLSTYLFAFVAGEFQTCAANQNERKINLYHRETDSLRLEQIPEIFKQVFSSLDWLESYTGIPYPFAKYDLILLPGFQYGGMEHTGATLYNDQQLFLGANATEVDQLRRMKLIAHETAHMWFGDYVTMQWFNEVWLKEVFANYFAAKMTEPYFTTVDHDLNNLRTFFPAAYSEDRTRGATPVIQSLPNLKDAGLIYGNIIYNKTPIIMQMLVEQIGESAFQKGIQTYLRKFAYNNATWHDLITILDTYSTINLHTWSEQWVRQKGYPYFVVSRCSDEELKIAPQDTFAHHRWQQPIAIQLVSQNNTATKRIIELNFNGIATTIPVKKDEVIIPNCYGKTYGYWKLDTISQNYILTHLVDLNNDVMRLASIINLYESVLNGDLNPHRFMKSIIDYLPYESNNLIYNTSINYFKNIAYAYLPLSFDMEETLWEIVMNEKRRDFKIIAFETYLSLFSSQKSINRVYALWDRQSKLFGIEITERNEINMAYQLAIRQPEKFKYIGETQLERIKNKDRRHEFAYIYRAVHPDIVQRDSLFELLLNPEERVIEPWCNAALHLLNHPLRQNDALKYIYPALLELTEIQETGDIFFPKSWLQALLSGHHSLKASATLKQFLDDHPNFPYLLKQKVLQSADHLKSPIKL